MTRRAKRARFYARKKLYRRSPFVYFGSYSRHKQVGPGLFVGPAGLGKTTQLWQRVNGGELFSHTLASDLQQRGWIKKIRAADLKSKPVEFDDRLIDSFYVDEITPVEALMQRRVSPFKVEAFMKLPSIHNIPRNTEFDKLFTRGDDNFHYYRKD